MTKEHFSQMARLLSGWPGYLLFAAVVLGMRFYFIDRYGNPTPYWDQWDAEAAALYKPWLEGTLDWQDLLAPHNEHRIFFPRIWSLLLLVCNGGEWNPVLQMQANACLFVVATGSLLYFLARSLAGHKNWVLIIFSTALFVNPYAWENMLVGFQSQFYFHMLFSFSCLWLLSTRAPLSRVWWCGVLLGVCAFLSAASGAFTLMAGVLAMFLRRWQAQDKSQIPLVSLLVLTVLAGAAFFFTPRLEAHASLKAQSVVQFLEAMNALASWPMRSGGYWYLIIHLPVMLLTAAWLRAADAERLARRVFPLAVMAWVYGQLFVIAYGRALVPLSPRYLDPVSIGLLVNLFACLVLFEARLARRWLSALMILWGGCVFLGLYQHFPEEQAAMTDRAAQAAEQESNVRAYLLSGDFSFLDNKPRLAIPYPDPVRLKMLLDDPQINGILHRKLKK